MVGRWWVLVAGAATLLTAGAVVSACSRAPTAADVAPSPAAPVAAPPAPVLRASPGPALDLSVPKAPPRPVPLDRRLARVYERHGLTVPTGPVPQEGCPPPAPDPGGPGGGPSWTPPRTVPDGQLPAPASVDPWTSDVTPFTGKGMWVWQYSRAEGGSYTRVVERAVAAGIEQLWVRVGDSRYGFYAAERLAQLVPLAHDAGIDVIGWGFPFLHDPAHDIAWSAEVLAWRGPHGRGLDGFSPDIERETEKVLLSAQRVKTYLSHVRAAAGSAPVAATVYPPADWVVASGYPYEVMAAYVDAFVPMDYWLCKEPGAYASQSIQRLADLRPVHVIGQAFHNDTHGRRVAPSSDETLRFLDVAAREGAIGASFWVWDFIEPHQWDALARYPWHDAVRAVAAGP